MADLLQRRVGRILLVILATAVPTVASAADPANGERIARRWCAACHVVAANQKVPTSEAPPFSGVAHKPGFDPGQLALFLLHPHPKMPDMSLTRDEAADIAAYVDTLK